MIEERETARGEDEEEMTDRILLQGLITCCFVLSIFSAINVLIYFNCVVERQMR